MPRQNTILSNAQRRAALIQYYYGSGGGGTPANAAYYYESTTGLQIGPARTYESTTNEINGYILIYTI